MGASARRILAWLGLVAVIGAAVLGSNLFAARDRLLGSAIPTPAPPAAGRTATTPTAGATRTSLRSQPWWQNVTILTGSGSETASQVTIASGAIQWRVVWRCKSGHLQVRIPYQGKPMIDAACPKGTAGYATNTGPTRLMVMATGPWRLEVAQQIDAPLVEPPLPAVTARGAAAVAAGSFYRIDKTGTGRVTVFRHADGRYSLRLDDFFVSPNADLQLRLSPLEAPRSSQQFSEAPSQLIAIMDVTAGSLNYSVPSGLDPTQYRSVVIWCAPINSAYAAATLKPNP